MDLVNRVVVVTGASIGIGRAIASAVSKQGAKVALIGRKIEGLTQTKEDILASGGQAELFLADLRDKEAIKNVSKEVTETLGQVDIVANVAGVWHDESNVFYGPNLAETPEDQIIEVMDVNIRAAMLLTRHFLPGMITRREGKVLNISGTFAAGGAGWLHYFVSKQALEIFTVGLADEFRKHQIQVNCISPSDVATEPLKKFFPDDAEMALDPKEVAELAVFLLSDPIADHITGQIIVIKSKDA